jgi:hypothetical protein
MVASRISVQPRMVSAIAVSATLVQTQPVPTQATVSATSSRELTACAEVTPCSLRLARTPTPSYSTPKKKSGNSKTKSPARTPPTLQGKNIRPEADLDSDSEQMLTRAMKLPRTDSHAKVPPGRRQLSYPSQPLTRTTASMP